MIVARIVVATASTLIQRICRVKDQLFSGRPGQIRERSKPLASVDKMRIMIWEKGSDFQFTAALIKVRAAPPPKVVPTAEKKA